MSEIEIQNYLQNYIFENNQLKTKDGRIVTDEKEILNYQTAKLVYLEAKEKYEQSLKQFGVTRSNFQYDLKSTMDSLSLNGEKNSRGLNKLINGLLECNGSYTEAMSGNNLEESKFSIFYGKKKELGIAYLRKKFIEKGLDIEDFTITLDESELKKNGVSWVKINFNIKKYEQKIAPQQINSTLRHPQADLLNELEQQKLDAKKMNDEVGYNYAVANIKNIISRNRMEIPPVEWDKMSLEDRLAYFQIKMHEARILEDRDDFNYWKANYENLQQRQKNQPTYNEVPKINSEQVAHIEQAPNNTIYTNVNEDQDFYAEMMESVRKLRQPGLDINERKNLIGNVYYYQGLLIKDLHNEEDIRILMTNLSQDLENNDFENSLFNHFTTDMEKSLQMVRGNIDSNTNKNESEFQTKVEYFKKTLDTIKNEYKMMLNDGIIDSDESEYLIGRLQQLENEARRLLNSSGGPEQQIIEEIIKNINSNKNNMRDNLTRAENIANNFGF